MITNEEGDQIHGMMELKYEIQATEIWSQEESWSTKCEFVALRLQCVNDRPETKGGADDVPQTWWL